MHTIDLPVTNGHGYMDLTDNFVIMPGDVLAHSVVPPVLLARTNSGSADTADLHCSAVTMWSDFTDGDCVSTNTEVHQLRAIYAQTSSVLLPLEFTSPGNFTIQVLSLFHTFHTCFLDISYVFARKLYL